MGGSAVAMGRSTEIEHTLAEMERALGTLSVGLVRYWLLLGNDPNISHEQAAERIGVDCRSVRRYEKALVKHGFLEVGRLRGANGVRVYRVLHHPSTASAN